MGLFSPGKMRFFSPRKKKAVLEEEEPVSASPLGDASTHAAYAAYESSFPRRDRRDVAPVVLHVAVASPAPPSPARAEASRDVGATTADERRDRDAESDALSEAGRDARETRGHGQTEVADSFVSTSARGVVDAEGVDDTAKRLRLEAFPRSLLSCAVADREKGWIFPSASLWARNPSATHAARFRVRAMRHEEVYVVPNRGVLPPGGCLELRVTPRPVADLAEDPDTVENGDAPPEPNALALVTVAATRASATPRRTTRRATTSLSTTSSTRVSTRTRFEPSSRCVSTSRRRASARARWPRWNSPRNSRRGTRGRLPRRLPR